MNANDKQFITELTQLIKKYEVIVDTINYCNDRSEIIFKNGNGETIIKMETPFDFEDLITEYPFNVELFTYEEIEQINDLKIDESCRAQGNTIICKQAKMDGVAGCTGCIFDCSKTCPMISCNKKGSMVIYTKNL